ncbi:MAG: GNAT family N-acetyltransferase [Candidatus Acidiferrum sp.]
MQQPDERHIEIRRATESEFDFAYEIVQEYYEAAHVVSRDSRDEFARFYFGEGSGVWLAIDKGSSVGCIALRPLPQLINCAEVKRLYVHDAHRGHGIAHALHSTLQSYAEQFGYKWLYLDTTNEMTAAIRFYKAQGYEGCERYNENPQATIFLRKELPTR